MMIVNLTLTSKTRAPGGLLIKATATQHSVRRAKVPHQPTFHRCASTCPSQRWPVWVLLQTPPTS
jgi:hypothetical protein